MKYFTAVLLACCTMTTAAHAHAVLLGIEGTTGPQGRGFAVRDDVSRTESNNDAQEDSSIIRDRDIERGETQACGETKADGPIDISAEVAKAEAAGPLPTIAADGQILMTMHQVNGDGAGPFEVDVSPDDGATFQPAVVTKDVPGERSRSDAEATDFEMVAQMPAGMKCAGGAGGNECIVRARNGARAGPFGGCGLVVQAT